MKANEKNHYLSLSIFFIWFRCLWFNMRFFFFFFIPSPKANALISSKKNAADLRVQPFASVESIQALLNTTKQTLEQSLAALLDRLALYQIAPSVRSTIVAVLQ